MSTKLSKDKVNEIREIFHFFDKNGSGSISTKEMGNLYRALGLAPTDPEINDIIAQVDTDDSGSIEFNEFLIIFENFQIKPITEDQLKSAFKLFDKDSNGLLSVEELVDIMKIAGEEMSIPDAEMIIKEFDVDNNNAINYNEFARMIICDDL